MDKPSTLPIVQKEEPRWYREGLHFSCTGCGKCCTGAPGYVWVTAEEIAAIAEYLNMDLEAFVKRYIRLVDGRFSLTEDGKTFDCAFLEGKKCRIYEARPVQCRTFPWWPGPLQSNESWEATAACCEGINKDAPLVSAEEIDRQCKLYLDAHPGDSIS